MANTNAGELLSVDFRPVDHDVDPVWRRTLKNPDGLDVIWSLTALIEQMQQTERRIKTIEANSNLTDTAKMFQMQMALNTWSIITALASTKAKVVADSLRGVVRTIGS